MTSIHIPEDIFQSKIGFRCRLRLSCSILTKVLNFSLFFISRVRVQACKADSCRHKFDFVSGPLLSFSPMLVYLSGCVCVRTNFPMRTEGMNKKNKPGMARASANPICIGAVVGQFSQLLKSSCRTACAD